MKMITKYIMTLICVCIISANVFAADNHQHRSQYAGQQTRTIKSLSDDDIKQLSEGRGWGLAKAAELNGVPGPAHLLEMKQEISLTAAQTEKIQKLFKEMNSKARKLGHKLIELEKDLNESFARNTVDKNSLRAKLSEIEKIRAELRFVHLATHLETPSILSPKQIAMYNRLRGYSDDPCKSVPKGHDKAMWLQHNNCN